MEAVRFDRLTRALAAGISRRRVLEGLGGAVGAAALATGVRGGDGRAAAGASLSVDDARAALAAARAAGTPAATARGLAANNATLFVQTASGGALAPYPFPAPPRLNGAPLPPAGATPAAPPTYLLTLTGHGGETVAFADRPRRDYAAVPTPRFLQGMFAPDNPPNAALAADVGGPRQAVTLLELFEPRYTAATQTLTYGAELLRAYPNPEGDALLPLAAEAGSAVPATFGQAALFIDDCPDLTTCYNNYEPDSYVGPLPGGPVGQCWQWGCLCCQPCNGKSTLDYGPVCKSAYPDKCSGYLHCNAG